MGEDERRAWAYIGKLEKFEDVNGHCRVPLHFVEELSDGSFIALGVWCRPVRAGEIVLTPEQREFMDLLGFVWNLSRHYEGRVWINIGYLEDYNENNGHCRVPLAYEHPLQCGSTFKLGAWCSRLLSGRVALSAEQLARCVELGVV